MVLMKGINPSSPSAAIWAGVLAVRNRTSVALFTDLSVAWADSTTDTSKVKGLS